MKKSLGFSILCGTLMFAGPSPVLHAGEHPAAPDATPHREESAVVTVKAVVDAIDYSKREVTLKGPEGNTLTLTVDQQVERLNEIRPGDWVVVDYYISIAAQLHKPTPEEEKNPIVVLDAAGKRPAGASPAAGGLRRIKILATIEALDRPAQTMTVKGPRGNLLTVRVADPSNYPKLRIGDTIMVTYTEALAVSIRKEPKPEGGTGEKSPAKEPQS
jgi:hypothetical protein